MLNPAPFFNHKTHADMKQILHYGWKLYIALCLTICTYFTVIAAFTINKKLDSITDSLNTEKRDRTETKTQKQYVPNPTHDINHDGKVEHWEDTEFVGKEGN